MAQVRLKQLAQDGATDTQVVAWDNAAGKWKPVPAGGGSGITTGGVDPTGGSDGDFYYNTVSRGFWYNDTAVWEEIGILADDVTIEIDGTSGKLQIKDAGVIATTKLSATGTKDSTTFLRGDDTWAAPPAGGSEVNDLTAAVTWADVPDTNVTEGSVTQHTTAVVTKTAIEAALTGEISSHTHAGGGGASDNAPACFRVSGSSNILNTADSQMVFDTTDVSNANYSLATGTVTVTAAGTYFISYSIPMNEDGTAGATRSRGYSWVTDDSTAIPQSYNQGYLREASGGGGTSAGFVAVLGAGSEIELYARTQNNTDVSSETGQAQLSIFKLGTG